MREAAHGIATLLLLTGFMGIIGMAVHAFLVLERALQGAGGSAQPNTFFTAQASVDSHLAHERVPFVIRP
jgi:hypothetical protein